MDSSLQTTKVTNVLLISPLLSSDDKRYGGDHSYTQTLLDYPPERVKYHHYETLLSQGRGNRRKNIQLFMHQLRLRGLIAPGLWFETFETDFVPDLIHIISFAACVRILGSGNQIPVVIGTSTGSTSDLRYYHNWNEKKVRRARFLQRILLRLIGAYETSINPRDARNVHVWSNFAHRLHLEEGVTPPELLFVIPPGVRPCKDGAFRQGNTTRFLFVGRDFLRKNGPMVLEAFHRVRESFPGVELILVGQTEDAETIDREGVTHYQFVPRLRLKDEFMPNSDVLLLPSKSEGFGLVLLEAMACNMALIGVDEYAMPEIIDHGKNGFLIRPNSLEDLVKYMMVFARQPGRLLQARKESRRSHTERFSVEVHNRRMRRLYDAALGEPDHDR